jgi:preprotein translocase subunit SecA
MSRVLKMGLLDNFKKLVGVSDLKEVPAQENDKQIKSYMKTVDKINSLEIEFEKYSNVELAAKTEEFKDRIKSGAALESLVVEAFAVVREASWRVLQLRHFDVQVRI